LTSGYNPNGLAIGDLNGDGRPDLVCGNIYDNTASVYQNVIPFGVAPSITSQPTNETIAVTGTAAFSLTVTGTPPLICQWFFNQTNQLAGATNTSLIITNVQFNQAGIYSAVVTNNFGSATSSNATLTVVDVLDHFAWNRIPSPRFVNAPFTVTIKAIDITNGVFTAFNGTVNLGSTNGIAINPPVSGNFVQGLWSGAVSVSQPTTNLVLSANDGQGHFGLANAINIAVPPILGQTPLGDSLILFWPGNYSNFVLETSPSLLPANWVPVSPAPVQIGGQYLDSIQMSSSNGFYRLRYTGP